MTSVWDLAADMFDPPDDDGSDFELARQVSTDLRVMIRQAWPLLEPARPFVGNWHIDCVAEHLMAVSAGELPRLIVNVPPGSTKSSLAAVMWPAWEWLLKPHIRWIVASYADKFVMRDARKMRMLLQSRAPDRPRDKGTLFERRGYQGVLALLGQGWSLAIDQNAKGRYDTTAGGMRLSTSVDGQATGDHGDRIVIDDPLNPKQSRSPTERENVNLWWEDTMKSRFIDEHAAAVLVQQRLHENDLTGHLLDKAEGWHHLCLPAEYIPSQQFTYPQKVKLASGRVLSGDPRTEAGQLLDPVRLGEAMLAQHRGNSFVFAGQYQQRPAPEGGGMFKTDWLERRWDPGFDRYLTLGWDRLVQSWDMAFKDTKGSDFVVGQLWGFHGADCYLLAQVRGRFDFTVTLHVVIALTEFEAKATSLPVRGTAAGTATSAKLVEDKANGTAVMNVLRRRIRGLIAIEPQGGKQVRAAAVAPLLEARNVILPASDTIPCPPGYHDEAGAWHDLVPTTTQDAVHELTTFPAGAHDDIVDAMSQALTWAVPKARPEPKADDLPVGGGTSIMGKILTERWACSAI